MRLYITTSVLLLSLGCHPSRPVLDLGPRPDVGGAISGMVSDGTAPLDGRKVTAVNVGTGARFGASSTVTGGYTIKVPAGMYRLELELRANEALVTAPPPTDVDSGDLDAGRDFVVAFAARR